MELKTVGLVAGAFLLGGLLGNVLSGSELKGRLSACKDMTSVINQALPIQLECEVYKGDVYVTSPLQPGVKVSLDGKDVVK